MGAINPAGVYGLARGLSDADAMDRERQAFDLDQATRRTRLANEQALQPLRTRSLELGIQNAEHQIARQPVVEQQQDDLAALNIDTGKLKKEDLEGALEDAKRTRAIHNTLTDGLRDFHISGDPTVLAESLKKVDPRFANVTASRGEDGSITFDGGQGRPITFRGKTKAPDGTTLSPEDEVTHFMAQYADPIHSFQEKYGYAQKVAIEGAKNERALAVAREGANARRYAADVGATSKEDKAAGQYLRDERRALPKAIDARLKTKQESGSFIAGYAHADDAELTGVIRQQARKRLEANKDKLAEGDYTADDAANEAIDDVREAYDTVSKKAAQHASALAKAKISPRDREAVTVAARAGNKDAAELLRTLDVAKKNLGSSIAKYLESNLPAK